MEKNSFAMHSLSRKNICVEIQGGLGNQLFSLAFGLYISEIWQKDLVVSERQVDKGITKHGVRVSEFDISINFQADDLRFPHLHRLLNGLRNRLAFRVNNRSLIFPHTYISKKIGFDEYAEIKEYKRYVGYFQGFKYAESLRKFLDYSPIEVRTPSDWFIENFELAKKCRPIMIHVRRGDYVKVQDTFGILSIEYYRNALSEIRKTGNNSQVWIFSDSPGVLDEVFLDQLGGNTRVITPPQNSKPSESLALMQFGSANVISNSTFSWWAAFLSSTTEVVICPEKWFQSMDDPDCLIPAKWKKIPSIWE